MSCTGSCNTDSGVRNPSTTASFVAAGGGGGVGAAAGAAAGAGGGGGGGGRRQQWCRPPRASRMPAAHGPPADTPDQGRQGSRRAVWFSWVLLYPLGLRLFQLLLPHLRHFLRRVGRDLLVHVELRALRAASVCDRIQRRAVALELGFGHERLDLDLAARGLGAEDLTATRRQIAHHGALILVGRPH